MTAWLTLLGPDDKSWRAIVKSNGVAVDDALREIEAGHVDLGAHSRGITAEETRACVGYACAHVPTRWRDMPHEKRPRLAVGRIELSSAFRHHVDTSQVMTDGVGFHAAKVLVAVYAVECGLKSLLLKQWRLKSTKDLESKYVTHDLNVLSQACCRKKLFPEQMTLVSKNHIAIDDLHQALRYGLRLQDDSKKNIMTAIQEAIKLIQESL